MRSLWRPAAAVATLVASGGILAAGIAIGPAFANGEPIMIGPFAIVNCSSASPCQTYKNASTGAGLQSQSAQGTALTGIAATSGSGVSGSSVKGYGVIGASKSGAGVRGQSTSGPGMFGSSNTNSGVSGVSTSSNGILGTSTSGPGVAAVSTNGDGLYARSNGGPGVYATSVANNAITGGSTNGSGVYGSSSASSGVVGVSNNADGVYAVSTSGYALEAQSSVADAVHAVNSSSGTAVAALANSGDAVYAYTNAGIGMAANTGSGNGADITGTYIGVVGKAPASGGFPMVLGDTNNNDLFFVDGAGNVFYHGTLNTFLKTGRGDTLIGYGTETTSPTVEDTGSGQLVDGVAFVRLDAAYAQAIDMRAAYHVMLTPNGDTRGLFVATKSPSGFVVREVQGGRGTLAFDYHIYASAQGHAGQRMLVLPRAAAQAFMPRLTPAQLPRLPSHKPPLFHH